LVSFFNELRYGLEISPGKASVESSEQIWAEKSRQDAAGRLQEFFDWAPGQMATLRAQLSKVCRATEKPLRVELLREFFHQLNTLKEKAGLPELRPAWLMTCGLQGLFQQLSMTATNINPSVLRTAAGAVDLLETLCAPGVDPNLAARTPVELLAVDDNAVCLAAVSLALKKAFRQPDLAAEGLAGLAFAQQKQYDAIFLDVEMPGMDGFELCQKIHETYLNRTTPIIFVTSHSDFNSRAQSTLVGGQDLIAKPFLSFEITVKALTLTLRGRLENNADEAEAAPVITPVAESA
jgi:CheY-like chemotaxis protein